MVPPPQLASPADSGIDVRVIQSSRPYSNQNLSMTGFGRWRVSYKTQHVRATVSHQLIGSHVFRDGHHRVSLLAVTTVSAS